MGRPKGTWNENLSLLPVCESLRKKLNKDIKLIKDNIYDLKKDELFVNSQNEIIILENIRFYKEEEMNDDKFSKHLASLGDLFVNDAFSCSHRAHSSVSNITKFLPSFAGIQFETEVNALKKVTTDIKKPVTCIIGGSKISTKISVIKNLIPKFDNLIIVGGMANNIIKYQGHKIGKSIQEDNCHSIVDEIFQTLENNSCSLIFPEDVVVANSTESPPKVKNLDQISQDDLILDIGPNTIETIKKKIEKSKTILWNGPAGYFENPNFARGSLEIGKKIAEKNMHKEIFSVAGGGDTVALLNKIGIVNSFNFVSTAGGAFLEYLEGKELPGIKALKND